MTKAKRLRIFDILPYACRCLFACTCIAMLSSLAGCGQSSSPNAQSKTAQQKSLAERISRLEKFDTTPIVHHFFSEPIDQSGPDTLIIVVSGDRDHHLYIFEKERQSLLQRLSKKQPKYDVAFKAQIFRPPTVPVKWYMWPDEALLIDTDGDGSKELFVRCVTIAADRGIYTFMFFARQNGSWQGYVSPYVVTPIREQLGDVGMYAEDFKEAVAFGGKKHYMQPLSNCGDCWHILPRPDGSGYSFLATVALSDGEATASPHRWAMIMYQFTDAGFQQDPNWNAGKVFVTDQHMGYLEFEKLQDNIIKNGYTGSLLR